MFDTTDRTETMIDAFTSQFGDMLRAWAKKANGSDTITLYELERDVRTGMHSLGEKVLHGLVDMVGTGKTEAPALCPKCAEQMAFVRYQGSGSKRSWVQFAQNGTAFTVPDVGRGMFLWTINWDWVPIA